MKPEEAFKPTVIEVPKRELEKVADDPVKSAKLFKLIYISANEPGITRKKSGDRFTYFLKDEQVNDKDTLARIRKLVIPPAWENVWICKRSNGHLQATGIDAKGRKQYRYHYLWNKMRHETKFFRLYEFGKMLPAIREQLEKDMALPGLQLRKVLAAIVMIMERTSMRIGNTFYEKLYGSFGLTTLKSRHVKVNGSAVRFMFKGKKGVQQDISLRSVRLARIIKKCHDLPGKELFLYHDEEGKLNPIDSGMVNDYIHEISGSEFSSKDFRTWAGTLQALAICKVKGECETATEMKRNVVAVLDEVAGFLGNTRSVCKKYYVHPIILELYENKQLHKYFEQKPESDADTADEKILMQILEWNAKRGKLIEVPAD